MAHVLDVAKYILHRAGELSAMKLEKLAYYCQAWSLAWDGVPLFDEDFQAWANGPVCPVLFASHRGKFLIPPDFYDDRPDYPFTAEQLDTMNEVLRGYGGKPPVWLSELTHKERPWRETRCGIAPGEPSDRVIEKELMQDYYGGLSDGEAL